MEQNESAGLRQAWIGSIAGWTFLLTAALLFGAVILAPKLLTYTKLQHDLVDRKLRLLMIEDAVERAESIAWSLEHEPKYAESLAKRNFENHLTRSTEEIPMPPELSLSPEVELVDQLTPPPAPYPWYTAVLIELTLNKGLTRVMLLAAAALTVFSFLTSDGHPLKGASGGLWRMVNRRYTPTAKTNEGVVPKPKFAQHDSRMRQVKRTPFSGPVHSVSVNEEEEG